MDMYFIPLELVLEIHDAMIDRYGGSSGVRDQRLLESALFTEKCTGKLNKIPNRFRNKRGPQFLGGQFTTKFISFIDRK